MQQCVNRAPSFAERFSSSAIPTGQPGELGSRRWLLPAQAAGQHACDSMGWAPGAPTHTSSATAPSLPLKQLFKLHTAPCWRILTEGQGGYIHWAVRERAMINLTSRTRKKENKLSSQKKPHQSSPWKAVLSQPGVQGVHSQLQWVNTQEHKAWLSLLVNMATNKHGPTIFLCSVYSFWLTSWNSIFHRMTTH